jgi:uncharacterized protein YjaG (DUF416 family)
MQFYGISFIHPYKQSGRWQDVLETCLNMSSTCFKHILPSTIRHVSSTSCHRPFDMFKAHPAIDHSTCFKHILPPTIRHVSSISHHRPFDMFQAYPAIDHSTCFKHILPSTIRHVSNISPSTVRHVSSISCHRPDCLHRCINEIP